MHAKTILKGCLIVVVVALLSSFGLGVANAGQVHKETPKDNKNHFVKQIKKGYC